jgi:flagellar hook-length control protein FliK
MALVGKVVEAESQPLLKLVAHEENSTLEDQVEIDPTLVFIQPELPSAPVLYVLKEELPAEDIKLYMGEVEEDLSPKMGTDNTLKVKEDLTQPHKAKEEVSHIGKIEKVTFTAGNQAEVKLEALPKFTEIVQQGPIKEEVARAITKLESPVDAGEMSVDSQDSDAEFIPMVDRVKPVSLETKSDKPQIKVIPTVSTDVESVAKLEADNIPQNQPLAVKTITPVMAQSLYSVKTPQVMQDVAVQMKQAIDHKMDKVTIQLNPSSLGKIHIELQFAHDGRVNAILFADKTDTYDLLQRNPQALKDALAEAGINSDTTDLSFNLRGEGDAQEKENKLKGIAGAQDLNGSGSDVASESTIYRQAPSINLAKKVDIHV